MRVFLSSTSKDLREYRDRVDHAIRSLGVGTTTMETFVAEPGTPLAECQRKVRESQALVAIVAFCYGDVPEEGGDGKKSFTWHEIEAAEEAGIPIFAFIVDEAAPWPGPADEKRLRDPPDKDEEAAALQAIQSLRELKKYLRRKYLRGTFANPDDLAAKVATSLANWHRRVTDAATPANAATPAEPSYRIVEHKRERDLPLPSRPYPLLYPHRHPKLFFGRERETAEVVDKLAEPIPILGLHAPSGAGKSSLLQAGVVPQLRDSGHPVAVVRHPAEPRLAGKLAEQLVAREGEEEPAVETEAGRQAFLDAVMAARRLAGKPPVLVIDQFEDVLRADDPRPRAAAGVLLAATVRPVAGTADPPCRWLLAYRKEYHGDVETWLHDALFEAKNDLEWPGLDRLVTHLDTQDRFWSYPLRPFGTVASGAASRSDGAAEAFRSAIEEPLGVRGVRGEAAYRWSIGGEEAARLATAFAKARHDSSDAPLLPELQVVLADLLDRAGDGGEIRVASDPEAAIGRALERHLERALDKAFANLPKRAARTARSRALLALFRLTDGEAKVGEARSGADLAAIIGERGAGTLRLLAKPRWRLLIEQERAGDLTYTLSHDRVAEVIVDLARQRIPAIADVDADLLALRPFIEQRISLFGAGDPAATFSGGGRFKRIANYPQILWSEQERHWWQAYEDTLRGKRNRLRQHLALAALIIGLFGFVAFEWTRREVLLSKIETSTTTDAFGADLAASDHWMIGRKAIQKRFARRSDHIALFEREPLDGKHWDGDALLAFANATIPLPESLSDDLHLIGAAAWSLDYTAAQDPVLRDQARDCRSRLLAGLPSPPEDIRGYFSWETVDPGLFRMGSDDGSVDELPLHDVKISEEFEISVHEVTNHQYQLLVPEHDYDSNNDLPVVNVSWYQSYAYAAWVGGRLPTEAEWEYAARADCAHPYCDRHGQATTLERVGWYNENAGGKLPPVSKLEPNPWGLYDMYGNAWEWTADWYGGYAADPQTDPWGPPSGEGRVFRGGCYEFAAAWARAAYREWVEPEVRFVDLGFRVVLPPPSGH